MAFLASLLEIFNEWALTNYSEKEELEMNSSNISVIERVIFHNN